MLSVSLLGNLGALAPIAPTREQEAKAATAASTAPQVGDCARDPNGVEYTWTLGTTGVGHWERKRASYVCPRYVPITYITQAGTCSAETPQFCSGGIFVSELPTLRTLEAKRLQLIKERTNREIAQLVALAPALPPCPPSSIDSDGWCYSKTPAPSFGTLIMPPGGFEINGVPFHVSELLPTGRFEKNGFVPDAEQRFLIDFAILDASHDAYADYDNVGYQLVKVLAQNRPDDFRTYVDGFSLNPVQPVEGETYEHWRRRGGYPISLEVLRGQKPIAKGIGIATCGSIKCACPLDNSKFDNWRQAGFLAADQQVTQWPRCIGTTITAKGLQSEGHEPTSWNVFVAMNEQSPTSYSMHLVAQEDTWYQNAAEWMADQLKKLAGIFCTIAPTVQSEMKATTAEKCIDKAQKPCAKGTPGCACVKAPLTAQVGVNTFNLWASSWCSSWNAEQQPVVYEPPVPSVPPEMAVKKFPWGPVIAGGLALVGVAAFVFTSPRRRAA